MNLVEAFEAFAPLPPDASPEAGARVAGACKALLAEANALRASLAARHRVGEDEVDDAIQTMLLRLVAGGERPELLQRTEAAVRAYLARAIRNNLTTLVHRDGYRKRRRALDGSPGGRRSGRAHADDAHAEDAPGSGEHAGAEQARAEHASSEHADGEHADGERADGGRADRADLHDLWAELLGPVLEDAAASARPGAEPAFRAIVAELVAATRGEVDWESLPLANPSSGRPERRPSTVHQHHTRARRRLLRAIAARVERGVLDPDRGEQLRRLVAAMKRRP